MLAAVNALRKLRPAQIVVAVPAAPESTCRELSAVVDDVVCATTPSPFFAVGESYWDFTQVTDDEVRQLLRESRPARPAPGPRESRPEVATVRSELAPMPGAKQNQDMLIDLVGDAHFVLLGEASHGTHEFYAERASITRRLIEEKGFCAVAVEADWPDAYRVNRFVRGCSSDETAAEALRGFERFPTWMWRNAVVLDFVGWLRERNDRVAAHEQDKAGFYGLDLYGLYRSIHEIISYLERIDPVAAERARERYACFDHFGGDAENYGFAAAFAAGESCEHEVLDQLVDLQQHAQGELGEQLLGLVGEPLPLGQDLRLEARRPHRDVGHPRCTHRHRPGAHHHLPRTLVPIAVTPQVTTAGISLAAQKLVDLGGQGTLEHSPSAVSDQPLEGCSDLVFGLGVDYARDVIVCFHRAFLHWLTGKVNREGTPLFMSAPEAPLASEFPHITTLARAGLIIGQSLVRSH